MNKYHSTEVLYVFVLKGSMELGEPMYLDRHGCVTYNLEAAYLETEQGAPGLYGCKPLTLSRFVRTKVVCETYVEHELRLL